MNTKLHQLILFVWLLGGLFFTARLNAQTQSEKTRIIVTSDGEIDDECSLVRFLLYANEWDVEGIITSSSQYHWQGHRWAGNDWATPYLNAYQKVYPNLVKHDARYPSPEYLRSVTLLGNTKLEGEMEEITPGSEHIVKVLLDDSDNRPVWIQAWGGTNTIARALKTIEEQHPEKMAEVAQKLRFFFIWEQDETYQSYIRPHWGKYNILTIICDQFWAIAYQWDKIIPEDKIGHFKAEWMKSNILENHGPLCSLYQAYKGGDDNEGWSAGSPKQKGSFRSEGDSPAFIYAIPTGLNQPDAPNFGGWGGRYIKVRENTWLDPVTEQRYTYPEGRWYTGSAWGRNYMRNTYPKNQHLMQAYFHPITRWVDVLQNDFAARADWCVQPFTKANHPPVVKLTHSNYLKAKPGGLVQLNASKTYDPDKDALTYTWWQYNEAGTYPGSILIKNPASATVSFPIPETAQTGETIHVICEVTDKGTPALTRYQRLVITVE